MFDINLQLIVLFEACVFLTVAGMQVVRRSSRMITLYVLQSFAVVGLVLTSAIQEKSFSLVIVGIIILLIKGIAAPLFFSRFITREQRELRAETYLNLPMTLVVLLGLLMFVRSSYLAPLLAFFPVNNMAMTLAISGIFISLLLVVNRRGVLAQLIGILSFENGLVAFSTLSGIIHSLIIEVWILFDILLWIIIAITLSRFVHSHFGTHDTREMSMLKQ